ncbi:MAG: hypothetical protein ACR2OJ_06250 [Hyphomicrobiales bacterium]
MAVERFKIPSSIFASVLVYGVFAATSVGANPVNNSMGKIPLSVTDYNFEDIHLVGRRGGGSARSRGARPHGGGRANRNVNRNAGKKVNKNVNRNTKKNVNRNVNKNVNRNVNRNVNVNVRTRPYGWRGARWGAVAFGVTMGAVIVVAANTPPLAPDPSLCWTWTNSALTQGYWYYCSGA